MLLKMAMRYWHATRAEGGTLEADLTNTSMTALHALSGLAAPLPPVKRRPLLAEKLHTVVNPSLGVLMWEQNIRGLIRKVQQKIFFQRQLK